MTRPRDKYPQAPGELDAIEAGIARVPDDNMTFQWIDRGRKGMFMNTHAGQALTDAPTFSHELRFASFDDAGRGVVVPCDECGHVDLDALTESLRNAYFGARALVGREYLHPIVQPAH